MFADDFLFERIVLKGGNALTLAHGLSSRASLDLDFSIENDFDNLEDAKRRVFQTLKKRFLATGHIAFDLKFEAKPSVPRDGQSQRWGGYLVEFKLMEKVKYDGLKGDLDAIRRDSLVVGPKQQRTFSIDLSKYEYTTGKVDIELDDYTVYVYTPEMIAIEKLRAICQQLPEYAQQRCPSPRARDFYDIHLILSRKNDINLSSPENLELTRNIFAAKEVPLVLMGKIESQLEFHRPDWPNVVASTANHLEDYDYYFDFVLRVVNSMKALWNE